MKVICMYCEHQEKGLCLKKKKQRVNLKKQRKCNLYKQSDAKVEEMVERKRNAKPIPTIYRPEWYHDRRGYINKLKKLDKEKRKMDAELDENVPVKQLPIETIENTKHPLTGDLSKFKSTVGNAPVKDQKSPNIKNK